jgi:cytochrome b
MVMSVPHVCFTSVAGENHKRIGIDMKILILFRLKWYMGSVDAQKSQKRLPHFVCLLKRRIGQGLNLPSSVLDRITGFS